MGIAEIPITIDSFFSQIQEKFKDEKFDLIKRAYDVAFESHEFQKRLSGEPYINHPVQVAYILYQLGLDEKVISAGLLHDVVEDTLYSLDKMKNNFGEEITYLVDGVTKISKIKNLSKKIEAAENIRKIILATIKDIRVILIKLADKTHNLRTISFQSPDKQKRIASETISLYAPIAGRLGIYKIKSELEDLSFQVLNPEGYSNLKQKVNFKKTFRDDYIKNLFVIIKKRLKEFQIIAQIEGRAKHFYSIHKKMENKNFEEIFDLTGIRIITNNLNECYTVLGIIHNLWKPIPGRFKDYIATPKTNLYQSLHTTVIGPEGRAVEVQIRTQEMNRIAEYGIAAHWAYKENLSGDKLKPKWLEIIDSWKDSVADPTEFLEELKEGLDDEEIFVFTPKGEVIDLPFGSTALDFAFRIHTDIGYHAKSIIVNGKIESFRTVLKSGDQIEVQTSKLVKPSPIWLKFLKTSSAKYKVRSYFRKIKDELKVVEEEKIPKKIPEQIINELKEKVNRQHKKTNDKIIVAGLDRIPTKLSGCCKPLPGDEIRGYITLGKGVSIHKIDCKNLLNKLQEEPNKEIGVQWDFEQSGRIPVQIEVRAKNIQGIYSEMVDTISETKTNIVKANAFSPQPNLLIAKFILEIEHFDQLDEIVSSMMQIPNVLSANRIK